MHWAAITHDCYAKGVYCRNGLLMLATFPTLSFTPNTDSFVKHINLTNNQRVKIGRQTETQTTRGEHAVVLEKSNKASNIAYYYLSWRLISCSGSVSKTSKARTARSLTLNDSAKKGSRVNCTNSSRTISESYVLPFFFHRIFTYLPTKECFIDIVGEDNKTIHCPPQDFHPCRLCLLRTRHPRRCPRRTTPTATNNNMANIQTNEPPPHRLRLCVLSL